MKLSWKKRFPCSVMFRQVQIYGEKESCFYSNILWTPGGATGPTGIYGTTEDGEWKVITHMIAMVQSRAPDLSDPEVKRSLIGRASAKYCGMAESIIAPFAVAISSPPHMTLPPESPAASPPRVRRLYKPFPWSDIPRIYPPRHAGSTTIYINTTHLDVL